MKKALILAGGSIGSFQLLEPYLKGSFVIAVDGGLDYALINKIRVDLCLGDFDSITDEGFHKIRENALKSITFPVEKDKTDLELALDYLCENNYDEAYLFGVTGSRLDHTISNINMLKKYKKLNLRLAVISDNNKIFLIDRDSELEIKGDLLIISSLDEDYRFFCTYDKSSYISFINTDETCIFSSKGFKWDLEKHKLIYASSFTVSNKPIKDKCLIYIEEGALLLFVSKD
ncbi:thiamine diphosphokinase [Peptoniphilaceae bacterium SGI.131]